MTRQSTYSPEVRARARDPECPGRVGPKLPAVRPRSLARALEPAGFVLHNVSGSHHRYVDPDDPTRWTIVPMHNRDLKPGTLRAILAQARLTPDELRKLL